MALSSGFSIHRDWPASFLSSEFFSGNALLLLGHIGNRSKHNKIWIKHSSSVSCSSVKTVRSPCLDRHIVKANKIRFVQKLKTLLLSKPKHYIPLHILSKCRSYLSLTKPKSLLSMIHRYPSIFELFYIPTSPTPLNATKSYDQLCVRLTPAAAALAAEELNFKSAISDILATKLQKLLMLSSYQRLLLSKLVHLAPDLGLPPNFRSRLCNDHPDKFKTVNTSYGHALELVSSVVNLAKPLPSTEVQSGLIVDRPLKFKPLKLRKGLNVKRRHREFLIRFGEIPDVCPYKIHAEELTRESIEAEKRACAVIREVLDMTVEKRTLIDHLTHFRKEFGLPNKLRAMIVRHPELFYVSLKGLRDSVLLVEGFDDKGRLLEKDKSLEIREKLMELVREGKRTRRERRRAYKYNIDNGDNKGARSDDYEVDDNISDDDDGFENLFDSEISDMEYDDDESNELVSFRQNSQFWTTDVDSLSDSTDGHHFEPW